MSLQWDPQQSTCLLLLWVSQICPMLLSAIQILVLTTLAPSPQHISTVHQDEEVVTVLGNPYGPCPSPTPWWFSSFLFLFFFLHCKLAVPFLHMLKPKQLSSSSSNIQTKSHWNSSSLLHLEKLQYFFLNQILLHFRVRNLQSLKINSSIYSKQLLIHKWKGSSGLL